MNILVILMENVAKMQPLEEKLAHLTPTSPTLVGVGALFISNCRLAYYVAYVTMVGPIPSTIILQSASVRMITIGGAGGATRVEC